MYCIILYIGSVDNVLPCMFCSEASEIQTWVKYLWCTWLGLSIITQRCGPSGKLSQKCKLVLYGMHAPSSIPWLHLTQVCCAHFNARYRNNMGVHFSPAEHGCILLPVSFTLFPRLEPDSSVQLS